MDRKEENFFENQQKIGKKKMRKKERYSDRGRECVYRGEEKQVSQQCVPICALGNNNQNSNL